MIETVMAQLRYGYSLTFGKRLSTKDLRMLVEEILRTNEELGPAANQHELIGDSGFPDDVRALMTTRRLVDTVLRARENTTYYAHVLGGVEGLKETLESGNLSSLPLTVKADLRLAPEAFLSREARPVFQAFTTGSTGPPQSMWFSRYEIDLAAALGAVSALLNGQVLPDSVVQINISSRATLSVDNTLRTCELIGAEAYSLGLIDPSESLSRLAHVRAIPNRRRATVLSTYPSYLALLVQEAEANGYGPDAFGLSMVHCAGEILTDVLRKRAEAVFGVTVMEAFGMTELFPVGGTVCSQRHLHFGRDVGFAEVMDQFGQPVETGDVGCVVYTPFFPYRETMPLFRFYTGDRVRPLDTKSLECELKHQPATSLLLGKEDWTILTPDRVIEHRDLLELVEGVSALPLPCRFHAERSGNDVVLHVEGPDESRVVGALMDRAELLGLRFRRIQLWDRLPGTMHQPRFRCDLKEETFTHGAVRGGSVAARSA